MPVVIINIILLLYQQPTSRYSGTRLPKGYLALPGTLVYPVDSERSGAVGKTRSEINVLPERIRICICTYGMGCPSTAPRLVPM